MRSILILIFISALAVVMACTSSAAPTSTAPSDDSVQTKPTEKTTGDEAGHQHDDEAPRITLAEAKQAFDDDAVVFLDTRSEDAYNAEHIKGAINIPMGVLSTRYQEIPKDKKIIAYCS